MLKPEDYPQCFRLVLAMQTLDKLQEQRAELQARQPDTEPATPVRIACRHNAAHRLAQVLVPISCTVQGSLLLQALMRLRPSEGKPITDSLLGLDGARIGCTSTTHRPQAPQLWTWR